MSRQHHSGFTVIEFIAVIVVIGIISVVTISRFVSGNAMNALVIRDNIITFSRAGQQRALGRESVELLVQPNVGGTELTMTLSDMNGAIESKSFSLRDVAIAADINDTDSCGVTPGATSLTNANALSLTYTSLGDLGDSGITGSEAAIDEAVRVCINGSAALSVCIAPSGFAYIGDCDD
ncbi:MAG: hypothetical protein RLZZ385_2551 [Pseudomonadota bacterium]|jgi:prepilin-type N-terminal cleavage/methylation domain-containing protein